MLSHIDKILSVTGSLVSKSRLLTTITDNIMSNFLPNAVAKAQCWTSGWFCNKSSCGSYCGTQTVQGVKYCYYWETLWYDPYSPSCTQMRSCVDPCDQGCWEATCPTCICPA